MFLLSDICDAEMRHVILTGMGASTDTVSLEAGGASPFGAVFFDNHV